MQIKSSNIKVAVDAIVFGYSKNDGVSVLLIKRKYPPFKNSWAIPGGFVLEKENLEEAVKRELASNPFKWKGPNLLGFALMEVRDCLNK